MSDEEQSQPIDHRKRPRNRENYKQKKAKELEKALKRNVDIDEVIKALYTLATGVTVQKVNARSGEKTVYEEKPDREAADILISHKYGKPTQKVEEEVTHNFGNITPQEMQKMDTKLLSLIVNGKRTAQKKN